MKLFIIPNRQYDPIKVVNNFTTQVKIRPFVHEEDDFDDLFESVDNYPIVQKLAALCLHPQQLPKFKQYMNKVLEAIPLKMMEVSQPLTQKEKENEPTTKDTKVLSKTDQDKSVAVQTMDVDFPSNMSEVWK